MVLIRMAAINTSRGLNTWCPCHSNSVSFKSHSIRVTFKICAVLGAQGIRAMGFKCAQGNQDCTKFESHTNRVTFETNAIRMTSSIQAPNFIINIHDLSKYNQFFLINPRHPRLALNTNSCASIHYNVSPW